MKQEMIERLNKFDDVEIKYCNEFAGCTGGTYIVPHLTPEERDEEAQADEECNFVRSFASVYLHYKPEFGTGVECVADCDVSEDAELIWFALNSLLNSCK